MTGGGEADAGAGPDSDSSRARDPLEVALDDIVRVALVLIDSPGGRRATTGREREVELIEGIDDVTLVLEAPGYRAGGLRTSVSDYAVSVYAPDFSLTKAIPFKVDPSSASWGYSNGVLWVRVQKSI